MRGNEYEKPISYRLKNRLMNNKFTVIALILCCLLIVIPKPISANPQDYDNITESIYSIDYKLTNIAPYGLTGEYYVTGMYVPNISGLNYFVSLNQRLNGSSNCQIVGNSTGPDYGTQSVSLKESVTGYPVGTGTLTYSRINGVLWLYLTTDHWFTSNLAGAKILNFTYLDSFPWRVKCGGDVYTSRPITEVVNVSDPNNAYFSVAFGANGLYANQSRILNYVAYTFTNWQRIDGFPLDTWRFVRLNPVSFIRSTSRIQLSYWDNLTWNQVYDETSNNDTLDIKVPHGYNVELNITAISTGNNYLNYWIFNQSGTCDILLSKGSQSNNPLAVDEITHAQLTYSGDSSLLGKVLWRWTGGNNLIGPSYLTRVYDFDLDSGNWSFNGEALYSFTDVRNQQLSFNYSDYDENWTGASRNKIDVLVYDQNNYDICSPSKRVYVGEPFTSYVRVWIYGQYSTSGGGVNPTYLLANSQLNLYDETENIAVIDNEIINTGVKLVPINFSHTFNASASFINYSQKQWCYNDEGFCTRTDGSIAYFTKTKYGVDTLELILYPFGFTQNATVTFFVSDVNNTPIEGALVHPSLGGLSALTNGVGIATFDNLINATMAKYTVSKTGWSSAEANYEIYDGEYIHIILYPVTPQPTATLPTTPTGGVPSWDPFGGVMAWVNSLSDEFKILISAIIMFSCALLLGSKSESPQAPLVGAGIGFLGCLGLGLLPFWMIIACMVIFGLIFASKITGGDE